ncbi:hypothetical protein SOVF_055530 [Spinacia oleracea]|nr:hypothetical protein SOVF_055530 [Spinacia oleracea]
MEALYSPTTKTLALIPRFSSSSSSSSSSSVCLCISKIQSIRSEFFGISPKLRLKSRRKCKRLRFHTTQVPVASLNSFPIVAVIVAAVTVSAVAVVFSNFYYSKRKKNSDKSPTSKYKQEEKDTRKVGYSSKDAALLHIGSLKEINYPSPEVGESISEDNVGKVNLSWKGSSSIPEDTSAVRQADFSDSNSHGVGAVASALMEKKEVDLSLPHASSQQLQINSFKETNYPLQEVQETTFNDSEGSTKLSYQDCSAPPNGTSDAELADFPDSSFHDLGTIASALSEKSEEVGLSLPEASPGYLDMESLKDKNYSLPEVVATTSKDNVCGIKLSCQDPSFTPLKTPDVEEADFPDSNFLGAIASSLSEKSVEVGLTLPEESPELDALQPSVHFTEESDSVVYGVGTDLNLISPVHVDTMHDAMSVLVDTGFTKDSNLVEHHQDHDEFELQNSSYLGSTRSGRDELYLFYENTSASDNSEHLLGINGSSTETSRLAKINFPGTTRNSGPKMWHEGYFQTAGVREHGPVASREGGSFHEGKGVRKVRRSLRSDTKAHSLLYDHQSVSDLPAVCASEVNSELTIPKNISAYNRLLKSGRLSQCIELLEDMDNKDILDMNKIYHAKFFDFCRRQKAVKEAFHFTKLIPDPALSTFNMLMSVCSAAQDSEGAFDVWLLVQKAGYKADCRLYTTLISTCAKSGKVDIMFEVFHEMVNAGVEPNLHTYGALIDGCARAGQVAKAFGVYGILRSKNVKPDRVVFNALITACGQSGAVERAFDVLAEMRSELQPIDPDHFTIGSLIRACTSAGQVDRVKGIYDMMEQFDIKGTPELYTIAANSCSRTGDWDFACNIYADMKRKGVVPDEMFFSALIDVAGHAGNLDAAFEVLQDARTEGKNPGIIAYSSLMGACSNTQSWEKALELFEHIKAMNLKPTVSTVNALITALCDAGQRQKALDVLEEMQRLGLSPNDITYSILIAASEKKDDLEVGLTLFSQAKADGVSFSQIIFKCLIKMCYRRFEKASTIGEPVLSFKSGRPQIDSKWTSLALMIYREMIGAGLVPSMEMLSQVLGCLQLPKDVSLKKRLIESLRINSETSRSANLFPLIDGFAEYDPRASSLFEEAASLGIVPGASFKENPIVIDATNFNIHIAEVYILTVLKGLKHRLAAGAKVPSITISLPVETTDVSRPKGEKTINVSARLSQAVGALFRRLRLPYQGSESSGKIKINGFVVKKWLQPKLIPSFSGNQAPPVQLQLGLSQFRLAKEIMHQQRKIRSGNLSLD